jgi:hypothetical protein
VSIARKSALIFVLIVCMQGGFPRAAEANVRRELLDALLAQRDWDLSYSNTALFSRGPVWPEEIEYLTVKADSETETIRRNAARLLALIHTPEAQAVLRRLAAKSGDEGVVVLALAPILDGSGGAALAVQRREAISRAVQQGGAIGLIALHAAFHAGISDITDEIRKKLADQSRDARDAATAILAEAGAGVLEAEVSAIVTDPERRRNYALGDLYVSLMHSDDPSTSMVLQQSLEGATRTEENAFAHAILLSRSGKPWLRELLLDMVSHENRFQWDAFDRLRRWRAEAPTKELVKICGATLRSRLAAGSSESFNDEGGYRCREFLGTLAGRSFRFDELRDAWDFASKWQAAH